MLKEKSCFFQLADLQVYIVSIMNIISLIYLRFIICVFIEEVEKS